METLQISGMSDQETNMTGQSSGAHSAPNKPATISVIISTKDRSGSLSSVLSDLSNQEAGTSFNYEVIVADNGSRDNTREMVEQLAASYPVPLRYVFEKRPGKAFALNRALLESSGEIVAFTDDDTVIPPTWLSAIHQTFETTNADGVGGPVTPQWISPCPTWLGESLLRQLGMVNYGAKQFIISSIDKTLIGPNCAYRKLLFIRHGGFDTQPGSNEDSEWFLRVFHMGHKLVYQPKVGVLHRIDGRRLKKSQLAKRFYRHGMSVSKALQRKGSDRSLFRIPLWVIRLYFVMDIQAIRFRIRGQVHDAVWHELYRFYYRGIIQGCLNDWFLRRPITPVHVPSVRAPQAGVLRIAIIAPEVFPVPPVRGGATETIIEEVGKRLNEHEVHVFSVSDPDLPDEEEKGASSTLGNDAIESKDEQDIRRKIAGKRVYHRWTAGFWDRLSLSSWKLPFKQSNSPSYYKPYVHWAANQLKTLKPDVIWLHSRIQFVPAIRKAIPDATIILSLHNLSNLLGARVWNQKAINSVDLFTGCSRYVAGEIVKSHPDCADKTVALHNGVDLRTFQSWRRRHPASQLLLKTQYGLSGGPVILYVGRLVEQKGVHVLIEAFAELVKRSVIDKAQEVNLAQQGVKNQHIDLPTLLIIGASTFSDPERTPYIEKLHTMAKSLKGQVRFAGHVSRKQIADYFLLSDVVAFPSMWIEPFGMTVLEGMAAGLPVVAFNQGGPTEIITHDRTGWLVPPEKEAAGLTEAFERLLSDPELRTRIGHEARAHVEESFTWDHMAQEFLVLCQLASSKRVETTGDKIEGRKRKADEIGQLEEKSEKVIQSVKFRLLKSQENISTQHTADSTQQDEKEEEIQKAEGRGQKAAFEIPDEKEESSTQQDEKEEVEAQSQEAEVIEDEAAIQELTPIKSVPEEIVPVVPEPVVSISEVKPEKAKTKSKHKQKKKKAIKYPVKVVFAESGSGYGGSSKYLNALISKLDRTRFEVAVIASEEGPFVKKIEEQNIPVAVRPEWKYVWAEQTPDSELPAPNSDSKRSGRFSALISSGLQLAVMSPMIALWLKGEGVKIVHLNNEILTHIPLIVAARLAGVRVVCHLHGWRPLTKMEMRFISYVDEFVCISESGAAYYREQLGAKHEVVSIPNGLIQNGKQHISEQTKLKSAELRTQLRQELGIRPDEIAVTIIGRLVSWKGHDVYLKALAKASIRIPQLVGLIVGHDPSQNESYLHELKRLAGELGIAESVRFIPWRDEVWSIYAASDVVVHASTKPEPFGLVILEAMALERPVIATRGGGVVDIVEDTQTGLLVSPGSVDELSRAIIRFAENQPFAQSCAQQARELVETSFTMERNTDRVTAVYERLLAR